MHPQLAGADRPAGLVMVSLPTATFCVAFFILLMLATFLLPGPLVEARSVIRLSPAATA